jgi:hypothetical protein
MTTPITDKQGTLEPSFTKVAMLQYLLSDLTDKGCRSLAQFMADKQRQEIAGPVTHLLFEWMDQPAARVLNRENSELFDALNELKCQCVAVGVGIHSAKLGQIIEQACATVDKYKAARAALGGGEG